MYTFGNYRVSATKTSPNDLQNSSLTARPCKFEYTSRFNDAYPNIHFSISTSSMTTLNSPFVSRGNNLEMEGSHYLTGGKKIQPSVPFQPPKQSLRVYLWLLVYFFILRGGRFLGV